MALLMGLVLLMIWTASPTATISGPKVTLPRFQSISATRIPSLPKDAIVLTITRKSEFFLNDQPVLAEHLQSELGIMKYQMPNPVLYLKADNALPFLWVIWASLQFKALDFRNVYLVVQVQEQPTERVIPVEFPDTESRLEGDVVRIYPLER
jgi:biopolymer transport protein ExbD